jgi:Zn-finger nucleic acid-binding protein
MSCIRNMGMCLCPRCTTPKSMVHLLGMKRDRSARNKLVRVDNHELQHLISSARRAIYERNFDVDSAPVERMMKPQSLVPTVVSFEPVRACRNSSLVYRTPILNDSPNSASIFTPFLWWTLCMRLNLVSGEHYLFTYFVFLRLLTRTSCTNWTDGRLFIAMPFF